MENFDDNFWDQMQTTMFFPSDELEYDCWPLEEAFSGSGESSSPDGAATSPASKNVVSERNRRQRLNQRLFALRSVVPNISKLDKASIIKDSISYIQELHEQEKRLEVEIKELESRSSLKNLADSYGYFDFDQELPAVLRSKKIRHTDYTSVGSKKHSPIEVLEMNLKCMGEKIVVLSMTCSKKTDTMVKVSEMFESLNLKIMTANFTSFSARLSITLFLEAEDDEAGMLESRIHTAIAAFNDSQTPMIL